MSKISSILITIFKNKFINLFFFMFIVINASIASVDSIPYPLTPNKLRLGFQTSGDGLLYRGLASDTITKPTNYVDKRLKSYVLLDTNTNIIWQYKKAVNNAWTRVGGSISSGLTGVLPVANGGTGQTTLAAAGINTGSGTLNYLPKYTATGTTLGNSSIFDNGNVGIRTIPVAFFQVKTATNQNVGLFAGSGGSTISSFNDAVDANVELAFDASVQKFNISGIEKMRITSGGNVGIGEVSPTARLQVNGSSSASEFALKINDVSNNNLLSVQNNGDVTLKNPLSVANGGTGQATTTAALNALLPAQSQSTTIGATLKSNGTNSYWDNFSASGTVQDQSGNFYNTIAIGTQVWFKENLRTKKYRSGALIPVKTNTDTSTIVGQMYYYNNDSLTNYSVYGALYNWKATQNSDSLCPTGWHVPTDAEWTTLTDYLGGTSVAGGKMKSVGTAYWNSPNTDATNETGFSAIPGGFRSDDGSFYFIRDYAIFWSDTENGSSNAWYRILYYNNGFLGRDNFSKSIGAPVRCLKN